MCDIVCPKCKTSQEVNHDDGYGYEEDVEFEQECVNCGYDIKFTTSISFTYSSYCSGDHELVPFGDRWHGMYECKHCDFSTCVREERYDKN